MVAFLIRKFSFIMMEKYVYTLLLLNNTKEQNFNLEKC